MREKRDVERLCREAFAVISAMVTHDLKNTLAIINENAGLLEDLAHMGGDDGVPASRLLAGTGTIAQQVSRSTRIIKNLNWFAHSGDAEVASSGIGEVVEKVAELTSRRAAMRKVKVEVACDSSHQVELGLIYLATFCCRLLLALYDQAEASGAEIVISSSQEAGELHLRFCMSPAPVQPLPFPGEDEHLLLAVLRAGWIVDGSDVVLRLPAD